jgi:hypothetical protein
MPLQNRIDPFGRLMATPARGAWTGNRGVLHGADRQILRPWRLKAWLICELAFKGRRREVMAPNRWTELFFLDEATALAAGHRPCCECRRAAHLQFRALAAAGRGAVFHRAADLDAALHADRLAADGSKRTYREHRDALPEGVFVEIDAAAWLVRGGRLHRWTPQGYADERPMPGEIAEVLTPRLTVEAIRAGYTPQMAL